jgi:glycosyltransferase involved in cell wall biosynthesis
MKNELPLVSIVTPSYNKGRFIEETILSVKNQTYPRMEHIVIDGGSTDETLQILQKYGESLIWKSEPDKGLYDASNKGLRMAKGEIVGWLMADDTYMPWAVETAVNSLIENPEVAMVYGNCPFIDEEGKVIRQFPSMPFDIAALVRGPNIIPSPTVFFRKHIVDEVGYFDTNLHISADYDLFIRIGLKFEITYIPKTLATYRIYPGTKTRSEFYKFGPDYKYIYDKLYSTAHLPPNVLRVRRQAYGAVQWFMVQHYTHFCDLKKARKHFIKAMLLRPRYHSVLGIPGLLSFVILGPFGSRLNHAFSVWKCKIAGIVSI